MMSAENRRNLETSCCSVRQMRNVVLQEGCEMKPTPRPRGLVRLAGQAAFARTRATRGTFCFSVGNSNGADHTEHLPQDSKGDETMNCGV